MGAVGKTVMSVPISAMMSWAQTRADAGTAPGCSTWRSQGSVSASMVAVSAWIWAL